MLVHSLVTSRLDYCNCLYAGVPFYLLERLHKIQNKAARLVLRKDRKHDSKELLRLLHWLPVQKRVVFKIACLVFKSLNNLSPSYIQDLIEIYKGLPAWIANRDGAWIDSWIVVFNLPQFPANLYRRHFKMPVSGLPTVL